MIGPQLLSKTITDKENNRDTVKPQGAFPFVQINLVFVLCDDYSERTLLTQ